MSDRDTFGEVLAEAIYQLDDRTTDPSRPFDGQPHTSHGERGKYPVDGLRFRDVADCFVIGWLKATGRASLADSGTATYNDVYEAESNDIDPLAVMQSMLCEMELRLGIYPNVPRLRTDD